MSKHKQQAVSRVVRSLPGKGVELVFVGDSGHKRRG